jgi:hypothetical protein
MRKQTKEFLSLWGLIGFLVHGGRSAWDMSAQTLRHHPSTVWQWLAVGLLIATVAYAALIFFTFVSMYDELGRRRQHDNELP